MGTRPSLTSPDPPCSGLSSCSGYLSVPHARPACLGLGAFALAGACLEHAPHFPQFAPLPLSGLS